ncbi:MAG: hypothetical protein ACKPKO_61990, partial [Candidatus Fonsibacter sp.]
MKISEICKDLRNMYIRYDGIIEERQTGQKKIGGARPAFSKMTVQVVYGNGSGKIYSILMGREFKPNQYAVLFEFDSKDEDDVKNGVKLAMKLQNDPYDAPEQYTPSSGLHYIFYVDGEQAKRIGS